MTKMVRCLYCGKQLPEDYAEKSTNTNETLYAHEECVQKYDKKVEQ
jgi:ribosomal protein S26